MKEYIISDDTSAVTKALFGSEDLKANRTYAETVFMAVSRGIPPGVTPVLIPEAEATAWVNEQATDVLLDPNACVLTPDRFMLGEIFDPSRIRRIGMVRTTGGERMARQGYPSIEVQQVELSKWVAGRKVTFVDDGVFTGSTIQALVDMCRLAGVSSIEQVIGVIGNGQTTTVRGIPLSVMKQVTNLYDWVDMRDFGVFGGKMASRSKVGNVATSVPYIAPFSDGSGASLNRSESILEISNQLLAAQAVLVESYQPGLRIRDLLSRQFPFPNYAAGSIFVARDTLVLDYIDACRAHINIQIQ